jgi:hypothetical protein
MYWNQPPYLLPLASETSFTEWYAKPSRAPTLICLHCCAILACSKAGILRLEFCNSDESLNYKPPTFGDLQSQIQDFVLTKQDCGPVLDPYS